MSVRIQEQILPGIGHRYDVDVGGHRQLVVIVQASGERHIAITDRTADEPIATVTLTHDQAVAVAALLAGARFSIETVEGRETLEVREAGSGDVAVDTVTLGETSPAIGRLAREVPLPAGSDAAILAVIRDETPELVEDEDRVPCRSGDRVVVAARRDRLADVVAELAG